MLEWLIPLSLFWMAAALLFGGGHTNLEGGSGFQQVLGLIGTFVLFHVVWGVLNAILGPGAMGRLLLSTVISILLLPVLSWVAFRIVGVRLVRARGGGH